MTTKISEYLMSADQYTYYNEANKQVSDVLKFNPDLNAFLKENKSKIDKFSKILGSREKAMVKKVLESFFKGRYWNNYKYTDFAEDGFRIVFDASDGVIGLEGAESSHINYFL